MTLPSRVGHPSAPNCALHINGICIGRIHFSIHYPDLDANARKLIWKQFISKAYASVDVKTHLIRDKDVDELARHEMNGRQVGQTLNFDQPLSLTL